MAERVVRLWPDPVLSQMCDAADPTDPALPSFINDLFDTMYAANGRGLAAPQIGVLTRVFVVDVTWKEGRPDPRFFINPKIISHDDSTSTMDEQCLSIPELPMPVVRPDGVTLRWQNVGGGIQEDRFDGVFGRCIQHELDHLNGTVIFDHQSPETRAELETAYAP